MTKSRIGIVTSFVMFGSRPYLSSSGRFTHYVLNRHFTAHSLGIAEQWTISSQRVSIELEI